MHIKEKYSNLPVQVRASLFFLICAFLQKGISVLSTPIFTRLLTASEYGRIGTFNSWYSILSVIVSLNLANGVYTSAMVKFEQDKKILASSYQGLTIIMCSLGLAVYLVISFIWDNIFSLTEVQMIGMFILIWTTAAFNLWAVEQRVEYNYKALVLVTLFVSITKPLLGIILVVNCKDKVTARIIGLVVVEIIAYSGLAIAQIVRGRKLVSSKYWKYAFRYNLPLIPHALSQALLSSSDRIMIDKLIGSRQAGYYNLAYNISLIMLLVNSSLSQTLAPWTYKKIKDNKIEEINNVAIISMIFVAFANLLLIAIAPEAIRLFAPEEYASAVYVIPPVAMSVYFMFLYDWFARFEYYFDKTKYILVASSLGAILNIFLNYLLIPIFGYVAAGYTTFFCYGLYCLLHYCFMKKICLKFLTGKKVYNQKRIATITLLFILGGFAFGLTYEHTLIRYSMVLLVLLTTVFKKKEICKMAQQIILRR
jgi:O-antigen/teichoic acid export membrane protein